MKTIRTISKEFYGDQTRWFVGTVVNSSPPYGFEGKVKVRIDGVHSPFTNDIPEADLPWASVIMPSTEAGVSGLGRTPKLTAGALVFGFFVDGISSQIPVIVGSLPKDEYPTVSQLSEIEDNQFEIIVPTLLSDTITEIPVRRLRRRSEGMKFFIDNGYTVNQAAGIMGNLDHASRLETEDAGIGNWNETRQAELIEFSSKFLRGAGTVDQASNRYIIQLRFVLHELRTSRVVANGKLLKSTIVEGRNGSAQVIKRYYIENFDPVDDEEVLEQSLTAREEVLRA